ncbi:hypothetical protein GJ496_004810 [Pomphorhynchus laevis]|nr:hypothetical protein GJ496_004810 [Pomphorhynchus laevis]
MDDVSSTLNAWTCDVCTFVNQVKGLNCEICNSRRAKSSRKPRSTSIANNDGLVRNPESGGERRRNSRKLKKETVNITGDRQYIKNDNYVCDGFNDSLELSDKLNKVKCKSLRDDTYGNRDNTPKAQTPTSEIFEQKECFIEIDLHNPNCSYIHEDGLKFYIEECMPAYYVEKRDVIGLIESKTGNKAFTDDMISEASSFSL